MSEQFKCIGLVGLPRKLEAIETHCHIYNWLISKGIRVLIEDSLANFIPFPSAEFTSIDQIGQLAELAIVIGGDGNMLRCARHLSHYEIKVIGVNRGNVGFLTDIKPENAIEQLATVIAGQYIDDPRFLLEVSIVDNEKIINSSFAVNEVVILPNAIAHLIDYDVYINNCPAFSQRADGLIISTPTGSTAYSLSAGGAILAPSLDAMIISPMFPQSLSARPLVIHSNNIIQLKFPTTALELNVACDSQIIFPTQPNQEVIIRRSPFEFQLIHAHDYNYFNNLSTKLGWSKKMY